MLGVDDPRTDQPGSDCAIEELIEMMGLNNINPGPLKKPKHAPHDSDANSGSPFHDEIRNSASCNLWFQRSALVHCTNERFVFLPVKTAGDFICVHFRAARYKRPRHLHDTQWVSLRARLSVRGESSILHMRAARGPLFLSVRCRQKTDVGFRVPRNLIVACC